MDKLKKEALGPLFKHQPQSQKAENSMSVTDSSAFGYSVSVFNFFPLPRTNVGEVFKREVNGMECVYLCANGVPYTAVDRRWIEIVTTLAKYQDKEARIEFGGINETLRRYGMGLGGRYITPAKKALEKIGRLHISTTRKADIRGLCYQQGIDFSISRKHQILWASGRTDLAEPDLFDKENFMELSPEFMELVQSAAPHVQEHYMQIQSPLTLDLYQWLVAKLYGLKDEWLFKWPAVYSQFGQGGRLNPNQMKNMRKAIKESLLDIKTNYYPAARLELTDEGVLLRPSPLLIEPDSKKAGFSFIG